MNQAEGIVNRRDLDDLFDGDFVQAIQVSDEPIEDFPEIDEALTKRALRMGDTFAPVFEGKAYA